MRSKESLSSMKIVSFFAALIIAATFVSCDRNPEIAKGQAVSGTVWQWPIGGTGNNTGTSIPRDTVVTAYESAITYRDQDGNTRVVPLAQVSDLRLK